MILQILIKKVFNNNSQFNSVNCITNLKIILAMWLQLYNTCCVLILKEMWLGCCLLSGPVLRGTTGWSRPLASPPHWGDQIIILIYNYSYHKL